MTKTFEKAGDFDTSGSTAGVATMDDILGGAASTAVTNVDEPIRMGMDLKYTSKPVFEAEDTKFSSLRLGQAQTPEVRNKQGEAGQFFIVGYDPLDTVEAIPVGYTKTRLYAVGEISEREVKCQSADSHIGIGDPGGSCAECPLSKWTANEKDPKKNRPPACNVRQHYILWLPEQQVLVELVLQKTGLNAAKAINNVIKTRGMGYFAISLTSEETKTRLNSFYVPIVRVINNYDENMLVAARAAMASSTGEDLEAEISDDDLTAEAV